MVFMIIVIWYHRHLANYSRAVTLNLVDPAETSLSSTYIETLKERKLILLPLTIFPIYMYELTSPLCEQYLSTQIHIIISVA